MLLDALIEITMMLGVPFKLQVPNLYIKITKLLGVPLKIIMLLGGPLP